jgi:L-lactate dehydrogenase (cytochrome)
MLRPASIADYRAASRRRVPRFLFDYTDGGSYAEQTLAANVADLAAIQLDQRVLVDVSRIDTQVKLLDQALAMPVVLAPVGLGGLHARRGEVQAWRAAREAGIPMALSTVSVCSLAEVTQGGGAAPWFQLYLTKDQAANAGMIAAAREQGSPAPMLTVDLPTPGARCCPARPRWRRGRGGRWMWDCWAGRFRWAISPGWSAPRHRCPTISAGWGAILMPVPIGNDWPGCARCGRGR